MPFAPMHELAKGYRLTLEQPNPIFWDYANNDKYLSTLKSHIIRTFEIGNISEPQIDELWQRITHRVRNTVIALQQATVNTVCINLNGGYHHAGKPPNTGYAYSLINDIIWAVDYQLEEKKQPVTIIDLDFHYGGGTFEYYYNNPDVEIFDYHHNKGKLAKHQLLPQHEAAPIKFQHAEEILRPLTYKFSNKQSRCLLNIGTDWYKNDALFGQYGSMEADALLNVWKETIKQITAQSVPLAITMGGGYGAAGLELYEELISWLRSL